MWLDKLKDAWPILRGAIAVFVLALIFCVVLLNASFNFVRDKEEALKQLNAHFSEVSRRYLALDEEELIIREQYPRYQQLNKQGIIGEEQRLSWVETLKRAGENINIPALSYEIDSRKPYQPEFPVNPGTYQIYASNMKLNLGMLNENDLFMLLENLDKNASGLYSVKECSIKQDARGKIALEPNQKNVGAACDLLWFSINLGNNDGVIPQ